MSAGVLVVFVVFVVGVFGLLTPNGLGFAWVGATAGEDVFGVGLLTPNPEEFEDGFGAELLDGLLTPNPPPLGFACA